MKVYEIIAKVRVRFQEMGVKKSGMNKFAGFSYYELGDILPVINRFGNEMGFTCLTSFTPDLATLTVRAWEDNSEIVFTSPMSTAALKGCHEVQNLGAVQTYIKRYLYQNAFEIVENDSLDATMGQSQQQRQQPQKPTNPIESAINKSLIEWIDSGITNNKGVISFTELCIDKNQSDEVKSLINNYFNELENGFENIHFLVDALLKSTLIPVGKKARYEQAMTAYKQEGADKGKFYNALETFVRTVRG